MIIILLAAFGLILGSFVNALVWRLRQQMLAASHRSQLTSGKKAAKKQKNSVPSTQYSILHGRSMCPHCGHELVAIDLVPVLSWLALQGKCRYCQKPISWQYPLVELLTSALFVVSYAFWPDSFTPFSTLVSSVNFVIWLVILVGFMALLVYDLKWMLLPNRIIYPLIALAAALSLYNVAVAGDSLQALIHTLASVLIAGGLFWGLFMVSKGKWIGGGDVKLGLLIGLLLADPYAAFLMLMTASLLGTLVVLPGMVARRLSGSSRVPFGPFLIVACILVYLFGAPVIDWYKESLYFTV